MKKEKSSSINNFGEFNLNVEFVKLTAFKFFSLNPDIRNSRLSQTAMVGTVPRHNFRPMILNKSMFGKSSYTPILANVRYTVKIHNWKLYFLWLILYWLTANITCSVFTFAPRNRITGLAALFIYATGANACIILIFALYSGISEHITKNDVVPCINS